MKRLLVLFVLFLGSITSLFGGTVEEGLKHVSLHEKICMRKFFDFAIKMDQAAHVLCFENKPVCLTGVVVKDKHRTFRDILCLKGWMAFKKNEHFFPHPNFIFSEDMYEDGEFRVLDIYIINKQALVKCLYEHLNLFKDVLGSVFSPEQFISKLEMGEQLPFLIDHNDMLLGVLLGYGEESSNAYKEAQVDTAIPNWTVTYSGIDAKKPKGCKIFPIAFLGNPSSSEVKRLLSIYDTELEEIWEKYQQFKDPLKLTLEQLCEN